MLNFFKPKPSKPKTLGQLGEEFAQKEYEKLGYSIIAKNEYNKKGKRLGEIDFIAKNKQKIVFVEVKTRTEGVDKFGKGVEAVDVYKQRKILAAVKMYFLRNQKYLNLQPQIDICLVEYSEVDPVKDPLRSHGVDKGFKSAKIIPNAVEDWN